MYTEMHLTMQENKLYPWTDNPPGKIIDNTN